MENLDIIEEVFTTISVGDIFTDDKYYSKRAEWCNNNGYYIEEIEPKKEIKDDEEIVTRQFQIKKPKEPTLEELKNSKHSQFKSIMQSKRNNLTCEYANDVFDCNEQAQSNMTSLMGFANLGMTEFSIRSTNEHTHVLTSEQLVELATIMSKTVNELYSEYWQYKNALYECETKEEVDNIRWE